MKIIKTLFRLNLVLFYLFCYLPIMVILVLVKSLFTWNFKKIREWNFNFVWYSEEQEREINKGEHYWVNTTMIDYIIDNKTIKIK